MPEHAPEGAHIGSSHLADDPLGAGVEGPGKGLEEEEGNCQEVFEDAQDEGPGQD